jgi:preprotein translocase subunit SecD
LFAADTQKFLQGNPNDGQPPGIRITEILDNARIQNFIVERNGLSESSLNELQNIVSEKPLAIVSSDMDSETLEKLSGMGFETRSVSYPDDSLQPWVWNAVGLRQIISLGEEVTNVDIANVEDAEPIRTLVIRGFAVDLALAQTRLSDLQILLESGSLSVSVKSISKESISPLLGENFLFNAGLIGLFALIAVALVIYIRYRVLKLTIPIIFIALVETFITVALASLISKFDLGAVAGIIAAVGTGVDDQIVITDELTKGQADADISLASRVKRAFFIVVAAAATLLAVMAPIVLVGFGLGKLVGFAITTIVGVLVGVLITRPAFGEIARALLEKD